MRSPYDDRPVRPSVDVRDMPTGVQFGESGPLRPPIKGLAMADKSPRSSMSKKSGKSLKEKRADKRTEGDQASPTDKLLNRKKN